MNQSTHKLHEVLSELLPETARPVFQGASVTFRDTAFACISVMRQGMTDQTESFVSQGGEIAAQSAVFVQDHAFWMWAAGEYLQLTKNKAVLEKIKPHLLHSLEIIEAEWQRPAVHWLEGRSEAVYLSNLAVYYAGVQAAHAFADDDRSMRLMKAIRELVFAKFIRDGHLVSELGGTAVHSDIIVTAIPFGMLGIEDRILIEALYKMEEQLVGRGVRFNTSDTYFGGCERPDLTAMLAWYYANKGDMARAKALLGHMEAQRSPAGWLEVDVSTSKEPIYYSYWQEQFTDKPELSPLSQIIFDMAQISISNETAKTGNSSAAAIRFIHKPTGYDDPYVVLASERFPRHPESGDAVFVHLQTQPFRQEQAIDILVTVNGKEADPIRMEPVVTADQEPRWSAKLGVFQEQDVIRYSFRSVYDERPLESESFEFAVRTWREPGKIQAVRSAAGRVELDFVGPAKSKGSEILSLLVEETANGPLRLSLRQLPVSEAFSGQYVPDTEMELTVRGIPFHIRVHNGELQWALGSGPEFHLAGIEMKGRPWLEVLTDANGAIHKVRFNWRSRARDRWFGMGERYEAFEYSGRDVEQYVYNQYRDQGMKTYMPVPFAIGSGGCGLYLDSSLYSVFRFRSTLSDLLEIEADVSPIDPGCTLYLFAGEPMSVVEQFTAIAGKPVLPPKWAFGPWMSSNNWDSQAEVMKQAQLTKHYGIPSTVLVIEQWSDEATFYIFNDAQYKPKNGQDTFFLEDFTYPDWGRWPNPKAMVDALHEDGLKVLLWQIPIHKHMYGVAHSQRDLDEKTLLENGYAVRNADGSPFTLPYNWFKDSHILDFTNPEACDWWFGKRRYLVEELGVDGFKTDGGEFVFGHDLQFHNGATGREMRNEYPNLYVGSYYRFVQQLAPNGGITFSRAGYTGAQQFPMHWAGDERSTFRAFRSSLIAGLTSSMSGIPFWGWDLAGFHGDIPSAELFIRSVQMAAFCPVMQYHAETKGEFNQDRTPWNIAERTKHPEVIDLYKRYADLRMNLLPYIYLEAISSSRSGRPMMRAMILAFPDDPHSTEMTEQYMFGESLLVAPVTEEGASTKMVYFPAGSWLSLFGPERYDGPGMYRVSAELADIPVFLKQDRIIPLNLSDELKLGSHVGNRVDRYELLCFQVFVQDFAELAFEDDLGTKVSIKAAYRNGELQLQWSGSTPSSLYFILRGHGRSPFVWMEGQFLTEVSGTEAIYPHSFCRAGNDLVVCIRADSGFVLVAAAEE